jgi:hypothetical protein
MNSLMEAVVRGPISSSKQAIGNVVRSCRHERVRFQWGFLRESFA